MNCRIAKTGIRIVRCIVLGIIVLLPFSCKDDLTNTTVFIGNDDDTTFHTASVTIGTQVWMTKNLRVLRYPNTFRIKTTTPATLNISGEVAPKYQWPYDGDETNVDTYGRLYTWYAISDPRNLCPRGWHVPTDEDWTILVNFLEEKLNPGGHLKETGTAHWETPNAGATNATDFTALPGGYRFAYGMFRDIYISGFWWSSSESSDTTAYGWGLSFDNSRITRFNFSKNDGLSVRCIKDKGRSK
jgi:uncharacterized protein (TIGR02145 family)